ncbi:hypothetical protein FHP05_06985 [Cerasibacillus terrae]|uniref:Uncharacterized protein n=1 Tax=Cerasibacillus terrae TaxID=2498845 RepID=A0A5C8NXF0_9BACI|nr:hypothetical protein [Cerasibacillus terrae]TXL65855.1 hypothetical protein FHP05_06985 [Cerasibacillus terrae]
MWRQIKGLLYFYSTDIRSTLIIFWSILISTTIGSIIISALIKNSEINMIFSLSFALYIFFIIFGFNAVKKLIPFSIKIGATRKNIFLSVGIFLFGFALSQAILVNIAQTIFTKVIDFLDLQTYSFVHPGEMLLTDTWINRVIIDTGIMFFMAITMYVFGLLFYKYGLLGGGSASGVLVLLFMVGLTTGWVTNTMKQLFQTMDSMFFVQMTGIALIIYVFTWVFMNKLTLEKEV